MAKSTHAEIDEAVVERLREMCRRFPGSVEDTESVGRPVFKVSKKIYAMQHGADHRMSLWFKAPAGMQDAVIGREPDRYFVPPYVGSKGWIGAWLDDEPDWDALADFVEESYRMTATKKLIRELDAHS